MKIVICASMSFAEKILEIEKRLKEDGHEIFFHKNVEKHLEREFSSSENIQDKMEGDVIRVYFEKIKNSDAILALNYDKKGIENYIGGNVFLEMGICACTG